MSAAGDVIAELSRERDIREVYHRYCDLIDSRRFDQLGQVFLADCVRRYQGVDGSEIVRDSDGDGGSRQGLAPLVERLTAGSWHRTHHNILNLRVENQDGGVRARAHFYAVHQREAGSPVLSLWGEYDDDFVETPDGWRIRERRYSTWLKDGDWSWRTD